MRRHVCEVLITCCFILFLLSVTVGYSLISTSFSMSGNAYIYPVNEKELYYAVARQNLGTAEKNGIDFSLPSSGTTNGRGVYLYSEQTSGYPIYYFRGGVTNNNVIYGTSCWKIVRTTSSGGVKLIYNGDVIGGACNNTGVVSELGKSVFNTDATSITSSQFLSYSSEISSVMNEIKYIEWFGLYDLDLVERNMSGSTYYYMDDVVYRGTVYNPTGNVASYSWDSNYQDLVGKYTCLSGSPSCSTMYYVYWADSTYAKLVLLNNGLTKESVLSEYETNATSNSSTDLIYFCKSVSWNGTQYSGADSDCVYYNKNDLVNNWYNPDDIENSIVYKLDVGEYNYTNFSNNVAIGNSVYYIYRWNTEADGAPSYQIRNYVNYVTLSGGTTITDITNMAFDYDINSGSVVNSEVLDYIDSKYMMSGGNSFSTYLEKDSICIDRSFYKKPGYYSDVTSYNVAYGGYFSGWYRANQSFLPVLECDADDSYQYIFGMLSVDEVMLAGGVFNNSNSDYYLYTGLPYWTLSPYSIGENSYVFVVGADGEIFREYVSSSSSTILDGDAGSDYGVRFTLSLKPGTVYIGGDGSAMTPYIVS
ncbi:MAG: hypothetical protein IJ475_02805 [Bacilli bacterium]|nr:hypothetical protein [Bacilli bacterium]